MKIFKSAITEGIIKQTGLRGYTDIGHKGSKSHLWIYTNGIFKNKVVGWYGAHGDSFEELGDIDWGRVWSGRYEPETGKLSIVTPYSQTYREPPSRLMRYLDKAYPNAKDIHIFNDSKILEGDNLLQETLLNERVISIGLNPKHEKYRDKYRDQIHDILQRSYADPRIGGYGGISGSEEESAAIHADITNAEYIKAIKRDGHITAVALYKKRYGRKGIAIGTDRTDQGRADLRMLMRDDDKMMRTWGEVSHSSERIRRQMGTPVVPNKLAAQLTGKDIESLNPDEEHYTRKIGGKSKEKVIMGYPKWD